MLGVSERTLFDLTKRGQLRVKRLGRAVLYSVDELRRFLASGDAA
jgi:hypothetical protein